MKTLGRLACTATIMLACAATAQAQTTAAQMTGGWTLLSLDTETAEGPIQPFGPTPLGFIDFAGNGRFMAQFMRPDLPKIAANNRLKATAEENIAIGQGVVAFFGEWKLVDAQTGEVSLRIVGSSFANWNGSDQKRFVRVEGDGMTLMNPASPSAGKSTLKLDRAK